MKETAIELFFRYKNGEIDNFSNETILSCSQYLLDFASYIGNRPEPFVRFLLELPAPLFFYYLDICHFVSEAKVVVQSTQTRSSFRSFEKKVLKDTRIKDKISRLKSSPKAEKLLRLLLSNFQSCPFIQNCQQIDGGGIVVSLRRSSSRFSSTNDFYVFLQRNEIIMVSLPSLQRSQGRDALFEESLHQFQSETKKFELENRIRLALIG